MGMKRIRGTNPRRTTATS